MCQGLYSDAAECWDAICCSLGENEDKMLMCSLFFANHDDASRTVEVKSRTALWRGGDIPGPWPNAEL